MKVSIFELIFCEYKNKSRLSNPLLTINTLGELLTTKNWQGKPKAVFSKSLV